MAKRPRSISSIVTTLTATSSGEKDVNEHTVRDALVHADSGGPCRGAHGSCGRIRGPLALEFFEKLGKARVGGRAPKCVKPRIARSFAWDSHVDHFGSGKPMSKSLSDLGDGFRCGLSLGG
jgi:hypothetical protein